jgi:hypothetical protein
LPLGAISRREGDGIRSQVRHPHFSTFQGPSYLCYRGSAKEKTLVFHYLIKFFADSAGKKGGEFYTPAEVVRLLVQITKPEAGKEIYDPTVGSGGFLIQSHQYVEEQGEDPNDLALYGQDSNGRRRRKGSASTRPRKITSSSGCFQDCRVRTPKSAAGFLRAGRV